jgi:glycosyltransferase involved in cell wall biosynthesis
MKSAAARQTAVVSERDVLVLEGRTAAPGANRFVCMIAYTNYAIDARVRREAETLASQGFRVRCLTTKNGAECSHFILNGVEVRELSVAKYRGKSTRAYLASYLGFLMFSSAACLRLLAKGELDVVHVHNIPDFLVFAGLLPRLGGSKVVLDVHDSVPETFATKFSGGSILRKVLCLEEKLSALVAHKVICVNHPQRETLVARGIPGSKTFISMNVPDPSIFQRANISRLPTAGRDFNLVYHGTMAERLGVDLIIRAVARLRERMPRVRLHLWGHGDDLAGFQRLTDELGVADRVLFTPAGFALQELPRQLASMDLGVVGNRRSAATDLMLPVKLMEYVSQGIPAIVPRLKTIEHYFSDDMVSYYEPEDVQSLADSIHRLYCEPERRARQVEKAREFLGAYGWERQGADLVDFYVGLCGELRPWTS